MLTFEEQKEVINKVFSPEHDKEYFNGLFARGTPEEQEFNKEYILNVFTHRLYLFTPSQEFTDFVELHKELFGEDSISLVMKADLAENKIKGTYGHHSNLWIDELNSVLRNDNKDKFIELCTQFPECVEAKYTIFHKHFISIVELTMMFNAIGCFKYLVSSELIDIGKSYNLGRYIVMSGNLEIYRIVQQNGYIETRTEQILSEAIKRHENDIAKYTYMNYGTIRNISRLIRDCADEYNYELIPFFLENREDTNSELSCDCIAEYIKHILLLINLINKYDMKILHDWLPHIDTLIKHPYTAEQLITIFEKLPMGLMDRRELEKGCLTKSEKYNKPKEYIDKLINFFQ